MASFEVLMPLPGMPEIAERLERRVTLHKLWEAKDREATLAAIAPNVRAVVSTWATARVDAELMRRLPKLEIVAGFGVGYDHIDAAWAGQHGIVVTHTPGVLDEDVADLAIALTLAATRRLPQAERHLRAGRWPSGSFPLTASLHGRVMGVLGLGRIGKAIARRAEAFGLRIAYHGRHKQDGVAYPYYPTPLALAEACDILMVAAPGGPADAPYRRRPRARRARPRRRAGQYRARLAGRRGGADRGAARRRDPCRRARRLRARAERAGRADRARQRRPAAACRLGDRAIRARRWPIWWSTICCRGSTAKGR